MMGSLPLPSTLTEALRGDGVVPPNTDVVEKVRDLRRLDF